MASAARTRSAIRTDCDLARGGDLAQGRIRQPSLTIVNVARPPLDEEALQRRDTSIVARDLACQALDEDLVTLPAVLADDLVRLCRG